MKAFPGGEIKEFKIFKKLSSPAKVQDLLDAIPINFEKSRSTLRSPLFVLQRNEAHCLEGALLAAAIFWSQGREPLLLDLRTTARDDDHVVALFKQNGLWGAVSKTNHAVLRYRDPIYRSPREIALSYFNEYFLDDGVKTLRDFSKPFSLLPYGSAWLTSRENLWQIGADLDDSKHIKLFPSKAVRTLRKANKIEIEAGKIIEWKRKDR